MKAIVFVLLLAVCSRAYQLSDCDPIDPARCMLPFPNDFWLRNGTLKFGPQTFPRANNGQAIDPEKGGWNKLDGFSPLMPIMNYFANVSTANLPPYWDIQQSLKPDCPSILLDTETGKLVPHWVELDYSTNATTTGEIQRALMMWPAANLRDGRRYMVAYRNMSTVDGRPIQPSEAFKALRDNIITKNDDIESRRRMFQDIFYRLGLVGWDASTVQLAWSFTVGTRPSITNNLVHMRDDAFWRTSNGFSYEIKEVINFDDGDIIREVNGVLHTPQYVNSPSTGARLVLDQNGVPVYQGLGSAPFRVRIPRSLVANKKTGSILGFGHGLFGSLNEVRGGYISAQANQYGYVLLANLWIGLSNEDEVATGVMMATDLTNFGMIPDRCSQGVLDALLLMRFAKSGQLAKDPAMLFNGVPVLDASSPSYYTGSSQGGILGGVYMALSTDVTRGVLGVMGSPYSLLLPRSIDFDPLFVILKARYAQALDLSLLFPIFQLLWDRAEPAGFQRTIVNDLLPRTPRHQVILQHALGDKQVTSVGAYAMARSIGCVQFASNVHEPQEVVYGVPFISDNAVAKDCVLMTWDFPGVPPIPRINLPPPEEAMDTHGVVRKQQTAQDQMNHFFATGEIVNTCNGPCHGIWN